MKKFKKLIPALCMLLISAVMLGSSTFAWFSMNNTVTATGMSVQAKSSGALVISTAKMTSAVTSISATATDTNTKQIAPITYFSGDSKPYWYVTSSSNTISETTGTPNIEKANLTAFNGGEGYYVDYVFYIASAGDELKDQYLTFKVATSSNNYELGAYSIAAYVGAYEDENKAHTAPTINEAAVAVANVKNNGVTGVKTTTKYAIPSTTGVTEGNEVGLKVVLRVFVDGNLVKEDEKMTAQTSYNANASYYVETDTSSSGAKTVGGKYYVAKTYENEKAFTDDTATKYTYTPTTAYVNTANIPTTGTTLTVTITASAE